MTRLGRPTEPVRPSAPDPVDAWLDVLVTMLAIPKADRRTVRDELEDHLRSRIDDLLIHGLTQPQALEKAVAELGETADLARQLSRAHKPPRTRRYAMHALLIALTGTVVALGVNQVQPPSTAKTPSAVASPAETGMSADDPIAVRGMTMEEFVGAIQARTDRPVLVHWDQLESIGMHPDTPLALEVDPIPVGVVLTILSEKAAGTGEVLSVFDQSGLLEIGLRSQFDRRTITRRNYELAGRMIADLSSEDASVQRRANAVMNMMHSIQTHVSTNDWADTGGDLASISAIGTTLVVSAPQRMHDAIEALLADLHEQGVASEMARDRAEADRRHAELRVQDELIDRLKREYARASSLYLNAMSELTRLRRERNEMMVHPAQRTDEEKDLGPQLDRIDSEIRARELEADEHNARVRYLRSRLIAGEYEHLFSELPAPVQYAAPATAPSDPG